MKRFLFIAALAFSGVVHAATVTIDFEAAQNSNNNGTNHHGDVFAEDGYRITDLDGYFDLASWGADSLSYAGSIAMFNNTRGATTELSQFGGGTFDLFSIDLAPLHRSGNQQEPEHRPYYNAVTFTTNTGHSQTFEVANTEGNWIYDSFWEYYYTDGPPVLQTFQFDAGFRGVTGVTWSQGGLQNDYYDRHQFDNIVVSAVPIPAAVWLFASGLGLLGWLRRRTIVAAV